VSQNQFAYDQKFVVQVQLHDQCILKIGGVRFRAIKAFCVSNEPNMRSGFLLSVRDVHAGIDRLVQ
jgi:hypothetical protein